ARAGRSRAARIRGRAARRGSRAVVRRSLERRRGGRASGRQRLCECGGVATRAPRSGNRDSLELIRAARRQGAQVTCEVTPHHFTLDDSAALTWGTNAKMNPPLRSRDDVEALRTAIRDGTIDMIATDHAPHDPKSKRMEQLGAFFGPGHAALHLEYNAAAIFAHAANGVVGLETSLGLALELVHRSLIEPARLVEMM